MALDITHDAIALARHVTRYEELPDYAAEPAAENGALIQIFALEQECGHSSS